MKTHTKPQQIQLRTFAEPDMDNDHVEWCIASIKDMQIAIVEDTANLISKAYARPDNLEDVFAWVFDTKSEHAFSIVGCARALNQTPFELQQRYYRSLKRKINSLNSKVSQEKREFYNRLANKARTCLYKNANYVVCTAVEAEVAEMESIYRPH